MQRTVSVVNQTNAAYPVPPSGRILVPPVSLNSISNFTSLTVSAYAVPVFVKKRSIFSGVAFGINGTCTDFSAKIAVYKDLGGVPGSKVDGTDATGGPYTEAASASKNIAFSQNVTLDAGWYWLVFQGSANQSVMAIGSTGSTVLVGAADMIQGHGRITITNTYTNGLPSSFGTPTYTVASGPVYLGLVVA